MKKQDNPPRDILVIGYKKDIETASTITNIFD